MQGGVNSGSMSFRSLRVFIILVVILIGCAAGWYYLRGPQEPLVAAPGLREAPGFALKDRSGAMHRIEDFRGKIVLLHFWAAWCPPCLSEMPELVTFAHKLASEKNLKIEVVTISEDQSWKDAEKVLPSSKLPASMISLLDETSKVSDAYGTYQFPETYLINTKGQIITKWIGAQPWSNPKAEELLEKRAWEQ